MPWCIMLKTTWHKRTRTYTHIKKEVEGLCWSTSKRICQSEEPYHPPHPHAPPRVLFVTVCSNKCPTLGQMAWLATPLDGSTLGFNIWVVRGNWDGITTEALPCHRALVLDMRHRGTGGTTKAPEITTWICFSPQKGWAYVNTEKLLLIIWYWFCLCHLTQYLCDDPS